MGDAHRPLIDDILGAADRFRDPVAAAAVPVMLVRATRSAIGDEEVRRLAEAVPGLTVADIDAGHLVARDAPVELAGAIGTAVTGWQPTSLAPKGLADQSSKHSR